MKYLEIKKDLFLVQQEIIKEKIEEVAQSTNHIWIYDRSFSMCRELKQLTEDLIVRARSVPVGDTLTLGWFSSETKFNWIVKGYKITEEKDYINLEKAIRNNNNPIGQTCFSEILNNTQTVVDDLKMYSDNFALCFFTDGYPVVSNYNKEMETIFSALTELNKQISSILFVGYSNYYNKQLMVKMTETAGGALIHADNLTSFNVALSNFVEGAQNNENKIEVEIDYPVVDGVLFGLNDATINLYAEREGKIFFTPTKNETDNIYFLTSELKGNETKLVLDDETAFTDDFVGPAYASAYVLTQKTKTDVALEVLNKIGDKFCMERVNNSFTPEEYGNAEKTLKMAAFSSEDRFLEGRVENYLPDENAPCLLDVIDLLMEDENAYFYPYHPAFSYRKITQKTVQKKGYPEFITDNPRCSFNKLSWNKTKLNLSVEAHINGHIELTEGYEKVGLEKIFPTFKTRNYSIVKDGFLNIKIVPANISENTFNSLKEIDVIQDEVYSEDKIYNLNLYRVPVINRSIAKDTNGTDLCHKMLQQIELESKLKALKYYKKSLEEGKEPSNILEEQVAFLEKHGVVRGGFNPPTEAQVSEDTYHAIEFKIKVAKHSSIPSVKDVFKKRAAIEKERAEKPESKWKKKFTPSELILNEGVKMFEQSGVANMEDTVKTAWLDSKIKELKKELFTVRSSVQRKKFAVILSKKWFDEFESRDHNKLTVKEKEFTFDVREVSVNL